MANDDLAQPHDNLFRAVFGEPAEAVGLLRAHLPPAVANGLQWSTLAAENSAFIAPDLRATESDLLYSIRRRAGGATAWLYVHVLIDHSETEPEGVRGTLKGRLAQLMMLAVYRAAVAWPALERALPLLAELARRGGREQSMFVWYVLATQREPMRGRFAKELQRQIPGPEGDIMNYVEEIKQQGRQEGRLEGRQEGRQEGEIKGRQEGEIKGRLETIEEFLRAGIGWPMIRSATGIDEQTYRALKRDSANGTERAAPP